MAAQRVHLNGGPWHDRITTVPEGHNHFHILDHDPDYMTYAGMPEEAQTEAIMSLPTREGIYSQVRGTPGEYEWDGWVTH